MKAYVGVTDKDWFDLLASEPHLELAWHNERVFNGYRWAARSASGRAPRWAESHRERP